MRPLLVLLAVPLTAHAAALDPVRLAQLLGLGGAPQAVARPSTLDVRLLGTLVAAPPGASLAAVDDGAHVRSVGAGDRLADAEVLAVEHRALLLLRGGRLERLELHAAQGARPPDPRAAAAFSIDRQTLDDALANPLLLGQQVQLVPRFEGGQPAGVSLRWVQPGSLVERLGGRAGDVLLSVNGHPSTDLRALLGLTAQLDRLGELEVTLLRGGQRVSQRYQLPRR